MVRKSSATTCEVLMSIEGDHNVEHFLNVSLEKSISCLERTEGAILSVISSSILIGWNTAHSSSIHVENSFRFVSLMYGMFSSEVSLGVSSSSVYYGRIGTAEQRFVTVVGSCIRTSSLLCQACSDIKAFALCTNVLPDFPARPVDRWGRGLSSTTIYEVRAPKLKQYFTSSSKSVQTIDVDSVEDSTWGWDDEYNEAFSRQDWELINSRRDSSDLVLSNVAEMLRKGTTLRRSL